MDEVFEDQPHTLSDDSSIAEVFKHLEAIDYSDAAWYVTLGPEGEEIELAELFVHGNEKGLTLAGLSLLRAARDAPFQENDVDPDDKIVAGKSVISTLIPVLERELESPTYDQISETERLPLGCLLVIIVMLCLMLFSGFMMAVGFYHTFLK